MFRIRWFQCRRYCRRFDLSGRLITSANGGQDRTCVYVSRWFSWLLFSFILFFSFQVAWVALVENVLCTNLLNNFLKKDFGLFRWMKWMNSVMVLTVNSQIRPSSTQKSIYRVLQELSIGVSHDIAQVKFKDLQNFLFYLLVNDTINKWLDKILKIKIHDKIAHIVSGKESFLFYTKQKRKALLALYIKSEKSNSHKKPTLCIRVTCAGNTGHTTAYF